MWNLVEGVLKDDHCGRDDINITYFPNDTFLGLDVHRVNQCKGNLYQVDRYGCRPAIIYLRFIILDAHYYELKIVKYGSSVEFKYPVRTDSYPVIR